MKERQKIKKPEKQLSGSLKVEPDVLKEVKAYCKENGILVSYFGTEALKDRLNKMKQK